MRRVWQHQSGEIEGFTKTYKVNRLVYYECFDDPEMRSHVKRRSKAGDVEEECISRNEESEMGGFITDAFSAYETSFAYFSNSSGTTMIEASSGVLRVLRGPSLRSG